MRIQILAVLLPLASLAQRPLVQVDTLVSPEVHADRRVTFRLRAPKAAEVTMRGEWMPAQTREKMTKDDAGVWSATLGPLDADLYSYSFSIDGVTVIDPRNPRVKLGSRTSTTSLLEVPGDRPLTHEARDVPHGKVEVNWYKSATLGQTRRFYVYTPPDYERNRAARYPTLYLLHGNGDTEGEWTWIGRANLIVDNLLAEGRARPMLVVMPFGHAVDPNDSSPESRGRNTKLFEQDLLKDVLPAVEARYRTASGPKNRAIAGLSMGGAQSLNVGLGNLGMFGSIGVFSAGAGGGGPRGPSEEFANRYSALLADPEGTNKKLSLLWIGCGEQDAALAGTEAVAGTLTKHRIRHTFRKTGGAHTWTVWRRYLAELVPLLFRETS